MKVRASIKKICSSCMTINRNGKKFIQCKKNPNHKQRQG